MSEITVDDAIKAHDRSLMSIEPEIFNCSTCLHEEKAIDDGENREWPCNKCYSFILFFHVNPTEWECKIV